MSTSRWGLEGSAGGRGARLGRAVLCMAMAGLVAAAPLRAEVVPRGLGTPEGSSSLPVSPVQDPPPEVVGPDPQLPEPQTQLVPVVKVARAVGWLPGQKPEAASPLEVRRFADGLDHPRWILVLPNGDVLVAEASQPARRAASVSAWVQALVMKRAGAGGPSADRITLLRDVDGDGEADERHVFAQGLTSPFGMALVGSTLYIANADALVSVPYRPGMTRSDVVPTTLLKLPAGRNHHWTKNVVASDDGRTLFITVGSNSNIGENGMDEEEGRAAVWAYDIATGQSRVFASGLRNPNGLAFAPGTRTLWTVVNERDGLGHDLVPDYLTEVEDGAFYGWPYAWWGQHVDERVTPQRPDLVARARAPDYALGAHVAALGLTTSAGLSGWPRGYAQGMFIGQHGSWNRKPMTGYQVVFVPFSGGRPAGSPVTVLSGFVNGAGEAKGRPVGVAVDRKGGLLVADDVGDVVWRVSARPR
jgi:glucose/arabinose dehydrogenase